MHHYPFHVKDYVLATAHLDDAEDLVYRRLLDLYYTTEAPLNGDVSYLARRIRMSDHTACVQDVLNEFFEMQDDGFWHKHRCDEEIAKYKGLSDAGRRAAEKRWTKGNPPNANPLPTHSQPNSNQEPRTKNQEPNKKGSRLSPDWVLPSDWEVWAQGERPDLNAKKVGDSFRDYWVSRPGAGGVKLDWLATWRNWVRSQKAGLVAASPVAIHQDAEKTKKFIDRQFADAVPMPTDIREKLKAIRGNTDAHKKQGT